MSAQGTLFLIFVSFPIFLLRSTNLPFFIFPCCYAAGPAVSYPRYLRDDYYADMESVSNIGSANLRFKEGVFVEALSDYPVREAQWVAANMNPCPAIVGYAYLSDSNVENTLKGLSECPRVCLSRNPHL